MCVLEGGVVCFLSFIVTDFTLRFRIYFELNFLYGNKIKVDFFHTHIQLIQHHLLRNCFPY